jgi:hypothetical protein
MESLRMAQGARNGQASNRVMDWNSSGFTSRYAAEIIKRTAKNWEVV